MRAGPTLHPLPASARSKATKLPPPATAALSFRVHALHMLDHCAETYTGVQLQRERSRHEDTLIRVSTYEYASIASMRFHGQSASGPRMAYRPKSSDLISGLWVANVSALHVASASDGRSRQVCT